MDEKIISIIIFLALAMTALTVRFAMKLAKSITEWMLSDD